MLSSPLALTNMHVLLKVKDAKMDSESMEEISCFQLPRSCKTFLIDLHDNKKESNFITCRCVEEEIRIFDDLDCGLEVQCSQMTISEEVIVECPPETLESITTGKWFQLEAMVKGFKDVLSNGKKIWAS